MSSETGLNQLLQALDRERISPLDLLHGQNRREQIINLVLNGAPDYVPPEAARSLEGLRKWLHGMEGHDPRVVVFGGGTGLSNVIGGDSRRREWAETPFVGLKTLFSRSHSIVCVTDDGGSTGELLKDLPLVALGDLRHVLLASIHQRGLKKKFGLDHWGSLRLVRALHALFNYRFISCPIGPEQLLIEAGVDLGDLPASLRELFLDLCTTLFSDSRLRPTLDRPQCLGNLLLAAMIYRQLDPCLDFTDLAGAHQVVRTATIRGLSHLCQALGMHPRAVLPCTTTSALLQVLYANGVLVTGEAKSGCCCRGYPVDRVMVEFCQEPFTPPEVINLIRDADILTFAPGSLYSSIIPILQVPGIARAVRENRTAMKVLVANIWVQKGETDVARNEPERKFYVSDLIEAYHRNIPDGIDGLFSHVLALDLADIPGSVLQRYALEDKEPIYLDRSRVGELGLDTVAVPVFSREQLRDRHVIQHDPDSLALAIHTLYLLESRGGEMTAPRRSALPARPAPPAKASGHHLLPCLRYEAIVDRCRYMSAEHVSLSSRFDERLTGRDRKWLMERVIEIIWNHPDILVEHLDHVRGICLVDPACWKRCQEWDNVYSFYDPLDQRIKISHDQAEDLRRLEVAFLIALGESLLGNYAQHKEMVAIRHRGEQVGRLYCLTVREAEHLQSFFTSNQIKIYLTLARMRESGTGERLFTRVVNDREGFTPPGLLFGLTYAWYLDNRFAPNVEYKMSIMKNDPGDLIPEQIRIVERRREMIRFFRQEVFRHPAVTEEDQ